MRSVGILPRYVSTYRGVVPKLLIVLQITLFGQSAGSISISTLYLNAGLENYGVRGMVSASPASLSDPTLRLEP